MVTSGYQNKYIFLAIFLILFMVSSVSVYAATQNASTRASPCGNGVIDQGEQCDNSNLAGQTCQTRGYAGGILNCNSNCTFNISACTSGSGGGGGGYAPPAIITSVIFNGRAYPKSIITILKDAQIAATTIADANANFSVTLGGLSGGNYIFSVYSEDKKGIRSPLLTFSVSVTPGTTVSIGGIFIAPTIAVDKSEVKRGDNITIFGQSAPNSEITISVSSDEEFFNKVKSDQSGAYLYNFDTTPLDIGQHFTKSKAALDGAISSFSKSVGFNVGTKIVFAQPEKTPTKGDANGDKRVNLIDFSIIAYWYKKPNPPITADLNSDGKVDLIDFSIMAFYWTG